MISNEMTGNVLKVYFDNVKAGWNLWLCLMSDLHLDSPFCETQKLRRDLEEAKKMDAKIIIAGDIFDAMQGPHDPRQSYADLKNKHKVPAYFDSIIQEAVEFLGPYAQQILLLGYGNHETSVIKHHGTDLLQRLVGRLNHERKANIAAGGFGGWVQFHMQSKGIPQGSKKLKYFHGAGSDAPVTRGAIQTNRQAVYLPDADIVLNGHNHNDYVIKIERERLSNKGTIYMDTQYHVRTPGYKEEYRDGSRGWHVERGAPPKPIGSIFVHLIYDEHAAGNVKIKVLS